ncbi:histidinol phosphatase [Clostridium sp. AL.422]|uniref:histidinol phosphatase n=1 Tax=Clostridium TaxID=1485 RepID=UPI00293DA55D|nr:MULTISPECIES: histidinol phosphatase [unclassified Clostridium]MDV4150490.1 histidinol phosphatase [Clostridium sp. AL.422]
MGRKKSKNINDFDKSNIKYYYGIPNYNTGYSTGKGSPIEAFEYAFKIGLNFMFITDHNSYLSEEVNLKDSKYSKFQASKIYAARMRKKNSDFIPLVGFKSSTNSYGDINIIHSNNFFTSTITDFKIFTLWMLNNIDAFISINIPNRNVKLIPYNEVLNKLITSAEVSHKDSNNKLIRGDKYYFSLLDSGWQLGTISKETNHIFPFGDSENLTACICNNLSTADIISAFRERRTYSTESRYLKFHFTINDGFMGEEIFISSNKLRFMIFAEDIKYKIKEIQIISNHGKIIRNIENINLNSIKYLYEHKKDNNETWYVIKIIQDDNRIACSSPIFISENSLIN